MKKIENGNNALNLPIGVLSNLARQAKTESENPQFVDFINAKLAYEASTIDSEYVLNRTVPCLPDYKKHQIRLEQGERFAVRLQEIFNERGINTDWNPNESNKLNVIGNIQFCWYILKPTIPAAIKNDWCPDCTTNISREEFFKTKHPKLYEEKAQDLEYMLNWILDVVVMLGLHNTKHGYSYVNLKNFKEAFESHYDKIKTPRGLTDKVEMRNYIKVSPFVHPFEGTKNLMECRIVKEMETYKTIYVETIKFLAETISD